MATAKAQKSKRTKNKKEMYELHSCADKFTHEQIFDEGKAEDFHIGAIVTCEPDASADWLREVAKEYTKDYAVVVPVSNRAKAALKGVQLFSQSRKSLRRNNHDALLQHNQTGEKPTIARCTSEAHQPETRGIPGTVKAQTN